MPLVLNASTGSAKFTPMSEGFQEAVVDSYEVQKDQPNTFYERNVAEAIKKGEDPARIRKTVDKLILKYKNSEGAEASQFFTLGANNKMPKSLRASIKSITGEEPGGQFDMDSLIGLPVTLNIEAYKKGTFDRCRVLAVARRKVASQTSKAKPKVNDHGLNMDDIDLGI